MLGYNLGRPRNRLRANSGIGRQGWLICICIPRRLSQERGSPPILRAPRDNRRVAVAEAIGYTCIEVLSNDESTVGEEPATEGGKELWQRI